MGNSSPLLATGLRASVTCPDDVVLCRPQVAGEEPVAAATQCAASTSTLTLRPSSPSTRLSEHPDRRARLVWMVSPGGVDHQQPLEERRRKSACHFAPGASCRSLKATWITCPVRQPPVRIRSRRRQAGQRRCLCVPPQFFQIAADELKVVTELARQTSDEHEEKETQQQQSDPEDLGNVSRPPGDAPAGGYPSVSCLLLQEAAISTVIQPVEVCQRGPDPVRAPTGRIDRGAFRRPFRHGRRGSPSIRREAGAWGCPGAAVPMPRCTCGLHLDDGVHRKSCPWPARVLQTEDLLTRCEGCVVAPTSADGKRAMSSLQGRAAGVCVQGRRKCPCEGRRHQ